MTQTAPFTPKGKLAEWKLIHDQLARMQVGEVITYANLDAILGRPFEANRSPFYSANQRLLESHNRGMVNVPGTGYRMVPAEEHESVARDQHRYAKRRLRRGKQWLAHADRSAMAPEDRARIDALEHSLDRQIAFTRQLDRRVERVEQALEESRQQTAAATGTAEKLDKLVDALRRHGIDLA